MQICLIICKLKVKTAIFLILFTNRSYFTDFVHKIIYLGAVFLQLHQPATVPIRAFLSVLH
jgi:hypothetical protein